MALTGGKKPVFFTKSDTTKEVRAESDWYPGRTGPKKRSGKDHKVRTGKAAMRKATHHYGSGGGA